MTTDAQACKHTRTRWERVISKNYRGEGKEEKSFSSAASPPEREQRKRPSCYPTATFLVRSCRRLDRSGMLRVLSIALLLVKIRSHEYSRGRRRRRITSSLSGETGSAVKRSREKLAAPCRNEGHVTQRHPAVCTCVCVCVCAYDGELEDIMGIFESECTLE